MDFLRLTSSPVAISNDLMMNLTLVMLASLSSTRIRTVMSEERRCVKWQSSEKYILLIFPFYLRSWKMELRLSIAMTKMKEDSGSPCLMPLFDLIRQ